MSRDSQFVLPEGATSTFARDDSLGKLPLSRLEDTLERYYRNLLPFGDENELRNSRRVIEEFKSGAGMKLHQMLEERAKREKNWVSVSWSKS
jgi:carnitine O-octanoyltransferase